MMTEPLNVFLGIGWLHQAIEAELIKEPDTRKMKGRHSFSMIDIEVRAEGHLLEERQFFHELDALQASNG